MQKITILSQVYIFIWLACKNVSSARGFLNIKCFTKGELFASCFNFDRNRSASKKQNGIQKGLFFSLVHDNERGPPGGGAREKVIKFLVRGRTVCCYYVNRFLAVCLLSKIYLAKLQFSRRKKCPKNASFGPNFPPWCPVQVFVRSKTKATVSSFIWSTNYTQSMREGFVRPFQFCLLVISWNTGPSSRNRMGVFWKTSCVLYCWHYLHPYYNSVLLVAHSYSVPFILSCVASILSQK